MQKLSAAKYWTMVGIISLSFNSFALQSNATIDQSHANQNDTSQSKEGTNDSSATDISKSFKDKTDQTNDFIIRQEEDGSSTLILTKDNRHIIQASGILSKQPMEDLASQWQKNDTTSYRSLLSIAKTVKQYFKNDSYITYDKNNETGMQVLEIEDLLRHFFIAKGSFNEEHAIKMFEKADQHSNQITVLTPNIIKVFCDYNTFIDQAGLGNHFDKHKAVYRDDMLKLTKGNGEVETIFTNQLENVIERSLIHCQLGTPLKIEKQIRNEHRNP